MAGDPIRLCFVCLGNICRSPTAAAVMRHRIEEAGLGDRISVESAGTSSWHIGEPPDTRAIAEAARRGVVMDGVGRRFGSEDFARFDLVLAMDGDNLAQLRARAPTGADRAKIHLLREFDPAAGAEREVPDPYFGGEEGFAHVYDVVDAACRGLLEHLRPRVAG